MSRQQIISPHNPLEFPIIIIIPILAASMLATLRPLRTSFHHSSRAVFSAASSASFATTLTSTATSAAAASSSPQQSLGGKLTTARSSTGSGTAESNLRSSAGSETKSNLRSSSISSASRSGGMDWEDMARLSDSRPYTMNLESCPADEAQQPLKRLPVLFLSHGSPMSSIIASRVSTFWKLLGEKVTKLPGLKSILIISAHWETRSAIRANTRKDPPTIHDFYGFPDELYKLKYPVEGSEELALKAIKLLSDHGIPAQPDGSHGLDHGAWVPLRWMLPGCQVPVVQLSLLQEASGADHIRIGQALSRLRDEGVLIVGSGSSVHNLRDLGRYMGTAKVAPYSEPFESMLDGIVTKQDPSVRNKKLVELENDSLFIKAHPTPEHFYPLNVAMGAAGDDIGRKLFEMTEMSIGNSAFAFGPGL